MANILIVDDSRTSRTILKNILEADGHFIVAEASNGKDGVEKYKEFYPDLTTMDITMPDLDGISALSQIMQVNPNAKIVMVTAAGQKTKIVEAIKLGAAEFLTKPLQPQQIKEVVRKVIEDPGYQ